MVLVRFNGLNCFFDSTLPSFTEFYRVLPSFFFPGVKLASLENIEGSRISQDFLYENSEFFKIICRLSIILVFRNIIRNGIDIFEGERAGL